MLAIGTSGWSYPGWRGLFYPKGLPAASWFAYYAERFDTTEVNYSFYHLPEPSTCEHWLSLAPYSFIFSLKVSRFITHIKRLDNVIDSWQAFVTQVRLLKGHLGPLLLQFPSNFHADPRRLNDFLTMTASTDHDLHLRLVFEFRHRSWFDRQIYRLLEKHNSALCLADSPQYPRVNIVTADFAYLRFHGRRQLFSSCYTDDELNDEAKTIQKLLHSSIDVYVYFNNDHNAHAVANARQLKDILQLKIPGVNPTS